MTEETENRHRKAKPTVADRAAAQRLKNLWRAIPASERPSQDAMAARWAEADPEGRGTQSLISQYMNGSIHLNLWAVLFFAHELKCDPAEIRDDLPSFVLGLTSKRFSEQRTYINGHDASLNKLLNIWPSLNDASKEHVLDDAEGQFAKALQSGKVSHHKKSLRNKAA